jgi:hypothetical protein
MKDKRSIIPMVFTVILVLAVVFVRARGGKTSPTAPVDNSARPIVIDITGPGIKHGSYTFFSNPLTISKLCANLYSDHQCRNYVSPADDRVLESGEAVVFPRGDEGLKIGKMSGSHRLLFGIPLDANVDGVEDLEAVPGIGPKTAERIVKHRKEIGPFRTIEELEEFLGARIKASDYFRVENPENIQGGKQNQGGLSR